MRQTTVRIRELAHNKLRALAEAEHRPMSDVLEEAIETYRRTRFIRDVNAGYAALRRDGRAEAAWKQEIADLDATLLDGLPGEEPERKASPKPARRTTAKR
jgi:predicted transcriptional regulator